MAYEIFNGALPNGASQNVTSFGQSTRNNFNALRDACIMGGGFFGWPLTVINGTGTAENPQYLVYANAAERLRATLTWVSGNVSTALYEYSIDNGGTYPARIGIRTINYSGGNVVSTTWGA